jgi:hypothetical protein
MALYQSYKLQIVAILSVTRFDRTKTTLQNMKDMPFFPHAFNFRREPQADAPVAEDIAERTGW